MHRYIPTPYVYDRRGTLAGVRIRTGYDNGQSVHLTATHAVYALHGTVLAPCRVYAVVDGYAMLVAVIVPYGAELHTTGPIEPAWLGRVFGLDAEYIHGDMYSLADMAGVLDDPTRLLSVLVPDAPRIMATLDSTRGARTMHDTGEVLHLGEVLTDCGTSSD